MWYEPASKLDDETVNLLVTNTRNAQAYGIVRALRPYARKIVATMEGDKCLAARLSHAANSRLVDERYYTPSPAQDWRAGRIQKENTAREEAYIQATLRICEKEQIDTVFPSFDPHVYVLSKNKERFKEIGVLIPIPDYEAVVACLDKYRTIRATQQIGFPCPKSYLPESEDDLRMIAEKVEFPLVVKPRFTAGGRGTQVVKDFSELSEKTRLVRERQGVPMIQEYIPGKQNLNFQFILDRNGERMSVVCDTNWYLSRIVQNLSSGGESLAPNAYVANAVRLVQSLGSWGGGSVQTKIDHRDGIPKLMEINPRLGVNLWRRTELGINAPLMCVKIARGEEVEAVKDYPIGIVLIDPIGTILGLGFNLLDLLIYRFRTGTQGKSPIDSSNPPMALKELIQHSKLTYFNDKKKILSPYFKYFFQDPLVSILWYLQFLMSALRCTNQLGR
jgi:biotin carboxylase